MHSNESLQCGTSRGTLNHPQTQTSELSRYLRVSRAQQVTNIEGQQVKLVVISVLESDSVAFAKETIQKMVIKSLCIYTAGQDDPVTNKRTCCRWWRLSVFAGWAPRMKDHGSAMKIWILLPWYYSRWDIAKAWRTERTCDLEIFSPTLDQWMVWERAQ